MLEIDTSLDPVFYRSKATLKFCIRRPDRCSKRMKSLIYFRKNPNKCIPHLDDHILDYCLDMTNMYRSKRDRFIFYIKNISNIVSLPNFLTYLVHHPNDYEELRCINENLFSILDKIGFLDKYNEVALKIIVNHRIFRNRYRVSCGSFKDGFIDFTLGKIKGMYKSELEEFISRMA